MSLEKKQPKRNGSSKKKRKRSSSFLKWFTIIFFTILFAISGGGIGVVIGWIKNTPKIDNLQIQPENFTSIIVSVKDGEEVVETELHGSENRIYATLDEIPDHLEKAFIAIEDERFYSHNGVDIKGIIRAFYINLKTRTTSQGASTLTQQLVKLNVLEDDRKKYERKVQEAYLALQVEKKWSKQQILETYLNTAFLSNNIYGVKQGAKYYFDKDISELTLAESALLAGITQFPSLYDPFREDNSPSREKQQRVLKKMYDLAIIDSSEYDEALNEPVFERLSQKKENLSDKNTTNSYFIDQTIEDVLQALQDRLGYSATLANNTVYRGGIKIYTTLDKDIQSKLDEVLTRTDLFPPTYTQNRNSRILHTEYALSYEIKTTKTNSDGTKEDTYKHDTIFIEHIEDGESTFENILEEKRKAAADSEQVTGQILNLIPQPQAAVAIIDPYTGYVKALSGGIGKKYGNRTFNRATSTNRAIGSTIKPISVFAPLMENLNYTAASIFYDQPHEQYSDLRNFDGQFKGPMTMRTALKESRNIPAVTGIEALGVKQSMKFLDKLGISHLTNDDAYARHLALGSTGISPLQLAAAYGAFVDNGIYRKPTTFYKIEDRQGNVLLEINPEPTKVFSAENAYIMTDILKDVIASGTGTAARLKNINIEHAGKTGTSSDYRDKLFVGYTPYYVASVWMGRDDNSPMKWPGGTPNYPGIIWREVMESIHADLPAKSFKQPTGIVSAQVCRDSGLLPTEACAYGSYGNRIYTEIFASGTVPTKYCSIHTKPIIPEEDIEDDEIDGEEENLEQEIDIPTEETPENQEPPTENTPNKPSSPSNPTEENPSSNETLPQ